MIHADGRADQRLGQPWSPRQQRKNNLLFHGGTRLLRLLARIPRAWRRTAAGCLGTLAWLVWPDGRRAIARGLANAGIGHTSPREVLIGLGRVALDIAALTRPGPAATDGWELDATSRALLDEAVASRRGVVFVTAHLGAWERMAGALAELGYPIRTLARASYDARFHEVYDRVRAARGVGVIYRRGAGDEFATTRGIIRALRAGQVMGMPMDIAGRGIRTIAVPFLGARRAVPVGAATLALRTGAVVVVGTPVRRTHEGGSVRIERVPDGQPDGDAWTAESLTVELAHRLETRIRALPTEWPWMLVADAGLGPLLSGATQEIPCATNSTRPSPAPTLAATSARCR